MSQGARELEWSGRWARSLLVLIHILILPVGPVFTSVGGINSPDPGEGWPPLLIGAVIIALQLHISLAVANAVRPRAGRAIVVLICALVYVPMLWFPIDNWMPMIVAAMTATLMVFHGWLAYLGVAVLASPLFVSAVTSLINENPLKWPDVAFVALNAIPGYGVLTAILYGTAWLVRSMDGLHAARAELAELAINRERLRLSRDLHDLLGQSLSAVSLKADLAVYLLDDGNLPGARVQTAELTAVARRALDGLPDVTSGRDAVSLREELASAAALLRAAEIDAGIAAAEPLSLPGRIDAVLAWSMREGITNVLRHSVARSAEIAIVREDGLVRLDIVNDGVVGGAYGDGSGLRGLASRVGELSGSMSAEFIDDDRFRLRVEIPLSR